MFGVAADHFCPAGSVDPLPLQTLWYCYTAHLLREFCYISTCKYMIMLLWFLSKVRCRNTVLGLLKVFSWHIFLLAYFLFCITHKNNIIFNHLHDMFHFRWVSSFYSTLRDGGKCFNYHKYCTMYIHVLQFILSVFLFVFFCVFFLNLSLFWHIYIFLALTL